MARKKKTTYKQCLISRGTTYWTAWIPSFMAKVGTTVVPKDEEPALIEMVWETTLSHEEIQAASQYHKTHREGTDI